MTSRGQEVIALTVGAKRLVHAALRHPQEESELPNFDRRRLRSRRLDQFIAAVNQLVLLRELHGDSLELLADLFDIGVGHGNQVTELSSHRGEGCGVSQVLPEVIFVNMSEELDSTQVAKRLLVTVGTVYKLRAEDKSFPKPVRFRGVSPMYDSDSIDAYIEQRSEREPSARGRRPRLVAPGAVDESVFAERLRRSIAAGDGAPSVRTQADLIELLGLNSITFGQRMRGRTRWKDAELALIAEHLQVDVVDANEVVDAARAARQER